MQDADEPEPHPIDLASLERGALITQEQIEKAIKHPVGTDEGRLEVLGFKFFVQSALESMWGDGPVIVRQRTYRDDSGAKCVGLKILTNAEASEYLPKNQMAHLGRVVQRHGQMTALDCEGLSDDQRRRLSRNVERSSAVTLALLVAQKEAAKLAKAKEVSE